MKRKRTSRSRGSLRRTGIGLAGIVAASAAFLATCVACGDTHLMCMAVSCDGGDAGADVSADVAKADVSMPSDAGAEGEFPFVGNWVPLPGAPANCNLKISNAPDKDVTPFGWKPCSSMKPGCTRLVVDWTQNPGRQIGFPWHPARQVGTKPYIVYDRIFTDPLTKPIAAIEVAATLDGVAVFAAGSYTAPASSACFAALRPTTVAILLKALAGDGITYVMAHFPLGQPQQATVHVKTQADFGLAPGPTGGVIQQTAGQGTTLVADSLGPFSILLYDPLADKTTLVGDMNGRIQSEFPVAVQGGAISVDETSTRGIYYVALDGSFTNVYVPQPPYKVFQIDADNSSSDTFVWLQGQESGFDYTSVGIWSAPYTTQSGAQAKRITGIASLGNVGRGMVANAGAALVLNSKTKAEIIRLSDGWGWSIDSETEDDFSQPVWIDAKEAWIAVGSATTNGAWVNSIVRYDRSLLGNPTIAPN